MKLRLLIFSLLCLLLAGCSNPNENVATTTSTEVNFTQVSYEKTDERALPKAVDFSYGMNENAPLISNSNVYGIFKLNFIEKLGIWDWNNVIVNTNGINYSYAINYNVDCSTLVKNQNTALLDVKINIVNHLDEKLSENCILGWSGFPSRVELYNGKTSGNGEINMQPFAMNVPGDALIRVDVSDVTSGISFDPIFYSLDILEQAKQGATLHGINDNVDINSICGAVYSIGFESVEANNRKLFKSSMHQKVYDLTYTINYKKTPDNDRAVVVFDSFDNNKLNPDISFYVIADNDSTRLDSVVGDACAYIDHKDVGYLTSLGHFDAGRWLRFKTNRAITTQTVASSYIRVVIEFPEEAAVRTSEEMRDFSGRYLVYQLPLTKHEFEEKEELEILR